MGEIINILKHSKFWFILSLVLLTINFTRKNNNFFDIRSIFVQQFKLFKECKYQVVIFYFVPLFLAIGTTITKCIDKDIINNIMIILSIFISMLFAMLSILNGYYDDNSAYVITLKETCNTIIFECILCITTLIISFAQLFTDNYKCEGSIMLISGIIYYLMFAIFLHTFIIIKRMKALFDNR
ncbi:hypothetical protein [Clostridium sp.]|jgi:hypothetical protein|uniref:hypothetical protein n=1 Tax=Clostridium sp. TaxID=1506 RepID=UPI002585DD96|nr:hypothetical protein [Clostridium sp.]MDF2504378.1 hypothetical protein [Clostridium sp.]